MRLQPYAATGGRAAVQVAADALVLVWVVVWIWIGHHVHDAVDALAAPGERLQGGANGLAGSLGRAASSAGQLPLIGSRLASPLRGADSSASQVAGAGAQLASAAHELAGVLGVVVALLPIAVVLVLWLPPRLRFALRAGEAGAALASLDPDAARRLLAVRALTSGRPGALARVSPDPVAAVAAADPVVLERLAWLERRRLGLRRIPGRPGG